MAENFDLEELVHLEQTFYDAGYTDGFAHGRMHGLIEGRALGREKGFEIWEEIGFYEGFAQTWQAVYAQRGQTDQRAVHHMTHLLDLIRQFPTVNPSAGPPYASAEDEIDLSKLQRQIRSRYKALCASLGVRPTLRAGAGSDDPGEGHVANGIGTSNQQNVAKRDVWTLEGDVWTLEGDVKRPTMQGLSF